MNGFIAMHYSLIQSRLQMHHPVMDSSVELLFRMELDKFVWSIFIIFSLNWNA